MADTLLAITDKLSAVADKLSATADNLSAVGNKLSAIANKLPAVEGKLLMLRYCPGEAGSLGQRPGGMSGFFTATGAGEPAERRRSRGAMLG